MKSLHVNKLAHTLHIGNYVIMLAGAIIMVTAITMIINYTNCIIGYLLLHNKPSQIQVFFVFVLFF